MWYVIGGLVFLVIFLLVSVGNMSGRVDEITNSTKCNVHSGCEEYIKSVIREHECFSDYPRRYAITEEMKMQARHLEEICNIRSSLEKQIRLNESFCDFKNREVTIKEALQMLFNYLKLAIKPGDDIKIVKTK